MDFNAQLTTLSERSGIEPLLEANLETLNHLLFYTLDVGKLAPPSRIAVFGSALNFENKLFHQGRLVPVFFPEMVLAELSSLFLPVLGT
jgi:hypothetical protein